MISSAFHPRRSCLYMPASNPRALEKAKSLTADVIIFDLEDAVAPEAKDAARDAACAAIASGEYGLRELVVRINGVDTPWFDSDLEQTAISGAAAIVVPKVVSAADIRSLSAKLEALGAPPDLALWVMVEMPLAVLNIAEIAAASTDSRLAAFILGFNDLAKEMRAEPNARRSVFAPAMASTVMAARAYGLTVLDSVYNDFNNTDGLGAECEQARSFGFDGKTLIHPAQIETANRAFAPSEGQISEARAIIEAFQLPENAGKGAITLNGKMTELLHRDQAQQTIALAEAIAALSTM